jgi:hypothetical protein
MTRASRAAAAILVLGALGVPGVAVVNCTGEPPTIYCVFENEALQGGRCLTECESRCNLERIAGCSQRRRDGGQAVVDVRISFGATVELSSSDTCVTDCEKAASHRANACLDASYTYWRCLRTSGEPHVTCDGDTAVFSVKEGTCETQMDAMSARCPPVSDGGADATAGD